MPLWFLSHAKWLAANLKHQPCVGNAVKTQQAAFPAVCHMYFIKCACMFLMQEKYSQGLHSLTAAFNN